MDPFVPLVRVHRGGLLESLHRGAFVLVEQDRTLLARGDPAVVSYYRSTSKPLQALAAVTTGAADALGITDEELAIGAGSHNAEPAQLAAVRSLLAKAGLGEDALGCGGHFSIDPERAQEQRTATRTPPSVWSNCSGKHALMLATAVHLGAPTATYLDPDHPVQATIRQHVARLGGLPPDHVRVGIDNCGAPAFALPLDAMARSLARFARPEGLPGDLASACHRVGRAACAHPVMIGGRGRFDTLVMQAARAPLVAKAGAEGVHGWCVLGRGLAMAVKVESGQDRGYRLLVVEALARLGLVDAAGAEDLRRRLCEPVTRTWAGGEVGHLAVDEETLRALEEVGAARPAAG